MNKKNEERRKTTSCGAVTWRIKNGRLELLLIKQFAHRDSWGIPKGHMDAGESHEQCALREVREETGVNVELGELLPECYTHFKHEDKTVVSYLARAVGDDTPASDDPDSEVAEARWIPADELPRIHLYQREMIATAIERLGFLHQTRNPLSVDEDWTMELQPPKPVQDNRYTHEEDVAFFHKKLENALNLPRGTITGKKGE